MAQLTDSSPTSTSCSSPGDFEDYGPNGLQVPGPDEVDVVATGVSAHRELFEGAAAAGASWWSAHHGLFWDFHPRSLVARDEGAAAAPVRQRHRARGLPPAARRASEVGNNALICAALGLERAEPFGEHRGRARRLRRPLGRGHPVRRAAGALRRGLRAGAVRLGHGPGARPQRRDRLRRRAASSFGEAIALGPRRVPHRRARRARDGRRARERHALHRRRALRDRDASACAGSASSWPRDSASSTSSWTFRTRSSSHFAEFGCADRHNRYPQVHAVQSDEEDVGTWRST